MTEDLKHYGILGMHWGSRQGTSSSGSQKKTSFSSETLKQKLKNFTPDKILTGRNVSIGILGAYGALGLHAAITHLQHNPIKIYVDYTKPPFKWKKPPFYSVKVGKSIARKLLPGG